MGPTSLFSQRLDRVAFLAYFLGSVVPLAALAAVAGRAAPELVASVSISWTAVVVSLALLSLGSFLALRRIARQAQSRIESDHRRLLLLLNASTALACAEEPRDAAAAAARHVLELTGAGAAFVFWLDGDEGVRLLAATDESLHSESLRSAAREAIDSGRPEIRWPGSCGSDGETWSLPSTAFAPLKAGGIVRGALAMVRPPEVEPGRFAPADLDSLSTLAGLAAVAVAAATERKTEPVEV